MYSPLLALISVSLTASTPKTITNPLGFQFDLQPGWSVAQAQDAFQVIRRPNQTENELYIVGGAVELDAKTSWDKRLQTEDLEMMKSLGPWSQLGGPSSFDARGGKGMMNRFAITSEGVELLGEVWSLVADKKRFGILAVYPRSMGSQLYPQFLRLARTLRPDPTRKISANNAHAREWSQRIAGFKFVRSSANNSGSLNGAAGDAVDRTLVFLKDGTFQYYMRSMSFISAGEFSGSSESNDQAVGTWSIQSDGRNALLVLRPVGKPKETLPLSLRGGQVVINGQVFLRTRI